MSDEQQTRSGIRLRYSGCIIHTSTDGVPVSGKYATWLEDQIATLEAEAQERAKDYAENLEGALRERDELKAQLAASEKARREAEDREQKSFVAWRVIVKHFEDGLDALADGLATECQKREAAERELAEARKDAMCDVCAGTGKVAAPEGCVCGGTGKAADALVQMREMYLEARKDGEDGERLETLYRMLQAEDWLSDDALMDVLFAESQGRDFRAALDAAGKGAQE